MYMGGRSLVAFLCICMVQCAVSSSSVYEMVKTCNGGHPSSLENVSPAQIVIPRKIPNILHFVYYFRKEQPDLPYWAYLNIKQAIRVQKPERTILHLHFPVELEEEDAPLPKYLEMLQPLVEIQSIRDVQEIFGRKVKHVAHKADVIRLEALKKYGGIYLDVDVILFRQFTKLMDKPVVLGMESVYGLCNAVILASTNSSFIHRWYDMYKSFNHTSWSYHSVLLPRQLSRLYPEEIHVVSEKAFYDPMYTTAYKLFDNTNHHGLDIRYPDQYAIHLWHQAVKEELEKVRGPEYFCDEENRNTSFYATYLGQIAKELGECDSIKLKKTNEKYAHTIGFSYGLWHVSYKNLYSTTNLIKLH